LRSPKPPAHPDSADEARDRATRLLAVKPRGSDELARELARRGFEPAAIRSALASLKRQGWLDDRSAARSVARSRASRYGKHRIARELASRGYSPEAAAEALGELEPEEEDRALARALARIWKSLAGLPPAARRRKAEQALARRGFPRQKVSEMIAEELKRDRAAID
jgi:regulatory protein